ncbi:2-polyprenyl-6-methoxyphenol hydroxylase-like FAD-dependent oxidoreductase [Agromyces terreus]|uniref:2-polyprenyl-6-methoxyphenol hydroxylase-like FAD-dependent oxidoreductase n=1 Tax=Agromyces terreus TaxID=424795 RepID=A0A9X2GW48_9MICO|nr:flavin-dependent oxidoreductase [Agromyces terreus]MCP2369742.1 2-polyprenyl-6-methoxyphenol hydroxylase-like FAD-dependent oxidoreductase [Agromyces terreus]
MKIIIVGAGIGGLATALSLEAAGYDDVIVVERARELRPLGVGINLLPHAVRELTELGLADAVAAIGTAPGRLSYFNRFGQPVWSEPRGLEAGYRWPQLSVHRGEFQLLLAEEVRRRLGADAIRLGLRATGVEHGVAGADGRVVERARFADAAGAELVLDADVVIGADGIHSALRAQAHPSEGAPPWNRLVLWRGTALAPTYLDGRTMIMAGDAEQKFVAYPLVAPGAEDGLTRVNFIAERRAPEGVDETADWNHAVDPAPIVELFADWRFDWLDVPAVIAAADEILEYPMVDRDPLASWTIGRTTLLGDAAHALYPNGSNGASQAILDARSLAFRLATSVDVDAALAAYEGDRRPATTKLNAMTRQLGPERVMQLAYERAPHGFADIHDVIPEAELQEIADGYKVAAGFHPEQLNQRSSLTPPARA